MKIGKRETKWRDCRAGFGIRKCSAISPFHSALTDHHRR